MKYYKITVRRFYENDMIATKLKEIKSRMVVTFFGEWIREN